MSPRTEIQNERIREERKRQIMNVALEVFAENGYSNSSIARIAEKAKISKGLMYNYFTSKEELIISIMLEGFTLLTETFDPNHDGVLTEEELHYFIDHSFDTLEQNTDFWRFYFMVLLQPDVFKLIGPHLEQTLEPFYKTAMSYFTTQGYEDPVTEVRFLAAMLDGVGLHFILDPSNFPLASIKNKMHQILGRK